MIIVKIFGIIVAVVVVIVVVGALLVVAGKPASCVDRMATVSPAASQALRSKWDQFKVQAAARPASVTFNESEVTSRGVEFLQGQQMAVEGLQVFLCQEGYAQATGVYTGAGVGIDVLVQGTLDLSGPNPRLDFQKIQAGNLPGFLTTGRLAGILSEDAKTLRLGVKLTSITLGDGQVTLAGAP